MATTITGKLNQAAREFQAGGYTGFGIRLGKQHYDRETKSKQWTNYEAAVFTNNTQQIEFYRQSLVEGAIVEVSAESEKIKQFQGNNGLSLSIELIDCKVGYIGTVQQAQNDYPNPNAPREVYGQPQQAPQQVATVQTPNNYAQAQGGQPNFNQPQR